MDGIVTCALNLDVIVIWNHAEIEFVVSWVHLIRLL